MHKADWRTLHQVALEFDVDYKFLHSDSPTTGSGTVQRCMVVEAATTQEAIDLMSAHVKSRAGEYASDLIRRDHSAYHFFDVATAEVTAVRISEARQLYPEVETLLHH